MLYYIPNYLFFFQTESSLTLLLFVETINHVAPIDAAGIAIIINRFMARIGSASRGNLSKDKSTNVYLCDIF
jgi:hypothetical protein